MSDRHVRILAMVASRRQRDVEAHDAIAPPTVDAGSRGAVLRARAVRTREVLAASRARRRHVTPRDRDDDGASSTGRT